MKKYFAQLVIPIFIIVLSSGCAATVPKDDIDVGHIPDIEDTEKLYWSIISNKGVDKDEKVSLLKEHIIDKYPWSERALDAESWIIDNTLVTSDMDVSKRRSIFYNEYSNLLLTYRGSISSLSHIELLLRICVSGYNTHSEQCLLHIEKAIELSGKIEHNHRLIGNLFLLSAAIYQMEYNNDKALSILEKGKGILAERLIKELKKRYPYGRKFNERRGLTIKEINEAKQYLRDTGYDPGKDHKVRSRGILYRLSLVGYKCSSGIIFLYNMRNKMQTVIYDLYDLDRIIHYIDLMRDGHIMANEPYIGYSYYMACRSTN